MKRVLVISYYWPPAGGVSVLRSLKIVKYLREFGWEPVVYIPSNAPYDYIDNNGINDIPSGVEVLSGSIIEPFTFFRLVTGRQKKQPIDNLLMVQNKKASWIEQLSIWIRANFFIPDARSLWIIPSVKRLSKYLADHHVDAIFTDGPPHTNTMIGYHLSIKFNIPWLCDFQDPWTQVDYYQKFPLTKWARKKHEDLERKVLKKAEKITIASPTWKNDLECLGAKNVDVIYYGYDETDFEHLEQSKHKDKFVIFHGGLLGIDRFPKEFFDIMADIDQNEDIAKRIEIVLAGKVDYRIEEYLANSPLKSSVRYLGFIPRKQVLQWLVDADLLLLPINKSDNSAGRLPGKLYEYLRSHTPIIAFGSEHSDAATIIKACKAGACLAYNDIKSIQSYILNLMNDPHIHQPDTSQIEGFSNFNQTRKISEFLNQINEQA